MGGARTPGAVDGLFSQDSVVVGGGCLFVVNAGSGSVTAFRIRPDSPTQLTLLNTVPSGGDFPVSLAYSAARMLLCVLNGGASNGVQCFSATDQGLAAIASTFQALGVAQTTPASGPAGSLSDIAFSPDSSLLFVSSKGVPGANSTVHGFIATYAVQGAGPAATLTALGRSSPVGSVLPFSLTPLPGTDTVVYTDPATGYGVAAFTAGGALAGSAIYPVPGQGANCWSAYSAATGAVYLSDPGAKVINEVTVNGTQSALVRQYPALGPLDIAVAGQYLYALSPRLTGIEVFAVASPGGARSIQRYNTSALAPLTATVQGIAVYLSLPPSADACPSPPAEVCCTRLLSNPSGTLRITLPKGAALSSLTVWNDAAGGPPLIQSPAQLIGISVSIGDGGTVTGCAIAPAGLDASMSRPGYAAWNLVCGSTGGVVSLSIPAVRQAPQPPSSVAVKACSRTDGGGGDARLLLQSGGTK